MCKWKKLDGVSGITDKSRGNALVNEILFVALQLVQRCPSKVRKVKPPPPPQKKTKKLVNSASLTLVQTNVICCVANTGITVKESPSTFACSRNV
jgi:hypothetical protein